MQKNVIITLIFAVFIAIFAVMNASPVSVNLIFTEIDISAALVILISAFIGAVIVYSIDAVHKFKLKKDLKDLHLEIQGLKDQNAALLAEKSTKHDEGPQNPSQAPGPDQASEESKA